MCRMYLSSMMIVLGVFPSLFSYNPSSSRAKKLIPVLSSISKKTTSSAHVPLNLEQFKHGIYDYVRASAHHMRSAYWMHGKNPCVDSFLDITKPAPFTPFAQKVLVPTGSKIAFFGDLHGNIDSVLKILAHLREKEYIDDSLRIIQENFYMVFLGDYVDRGDHGVEVMYTLLLLKAINPDKVFLVRGNHEDALLNTVYGFKKELCTKFSGITQQDIDMIYRCYDYMPTVLFLGSGSNNDFIQCCHGGMEIGYNAKELLSAVHHKNIAFQLLETIERVEAVRELPGSLKQAVIKTIPAKEIINFIPLQPTQPVTLGFMWNDFIEHASHYNAEDISYSSGRGWVYGKTLTALLLAKNSTEQAKIRAVFRAHQHHGGMLKLLQQEKGIVKLWDGMVHTFLTASIPTIDFNYASLGILTTTNKYQDWSLEHIIL